MSKNKVVIILLMLIIFLFISVSCRKNFQQNSDIDEWNGGYCILDNGRLDYIGTGNKVHYKCSRCGKEYVFDEVKQYEK